MPINPKLLAYQNILGNQPITPASTDTINPITAAYQQYLTTPADYSKLPIPENIIPQTIKGVKESHGIFPAILQGLGGMARLAGTGLGTRIASQLLGGDVYTGAAREETARGQLGQESALRQLVGQHEMERQKQLGQYGLEQMKAQTEAERVNALEKFRQQMEAERQMAEFAERERLAKETRGFEVGQKKEAREFEKEKISIASFEEKRKAIYEANKDIPGSEVILKAKDEDELNNISIKKGFKVPLFGRIGAKVGEAIPSTNPILEKWDIK